MSRGKGSRAAAAIVLPLSLVLALSACAAAAKDPVATKSSAATGPSATATPSQTPAASTAPPQTFGGDCNSMLSPAAAMAIGGARLVAVPALPSDTWGDIVVKMRGGLECAWGGDGLDPIVTVTALSIDGAVTTIAPNSQKCQASVKGSDTTCDASVVSNGYWLSWSWDLGQNAPESRAIADSNALRTALEASASAAGPAQRFAPASNSWALPVDCSALAKSSNLYAILNSPHLATGHYDEGPGVARAQGWFAAVSAAFQPCVWSQDDSKPTPAGELRYFGANLFPGTAWFGDSLGKLPGAVHIEIAGISQAWEIPDGPGGAVNIDAFDGVNWIQIPPDGADLAATEKAIPALLAALDASS